METLFTFRSNINIPSILSFRFSERAQITSLNTITLMSAIQTKRPFCETGTELLHDRLIHLNVRFPKGSKNGVTYSEKLDTVRCAAYIQGQFIKT